MSRRIINRPTKHWAQVTALRNTPECELGHSSMTGFSGEWRARMLLRYGWLAHVDLWKSGEQWCPLGPVSWVFSISTYGDRFSSWWVAWLNWENLLSSKVISEKIWTPAGLIVIEWFNVWRMRNAWSQPKIWYVMPCFFIRTSKDILTTRI